MCFLSRQSECAHTIPQVQRPRILVTAPSNAAVDVLVERVVQEGFTDRSGGRYHPPVLCVRSDSAEKAPTPWPVYKDTWVSTKVRDLMDLSPGAWQARLVVVGCCFCCCQVHLQPLYSFRWQECMQEWREETALAVALHEKHVAGMANVTDAQLDGMMLELVPRYERLYKLQGKQERLKIVEGWIQPRGGNSWRPSSREVCGAYFG